MTARLVATLLAGLAAGVLIGAALFGGDSEARGSDTAPRETLPEEHARGPTPTQFLAGGSEDPAPLRPTDVSLIPERLFVYAEQAYLDERRELGEPADASAFPALRERFEEGVLKLPRNIARWDVDDIRDVRALSAREQAVTAGSMNALLDALGDDQELADFSLEGESLDFIVRNRVRRSSRDGASFAAGDDPVTEGLVISFPAGIHALNERRLRGPPGEPFPTDVTIEGAGMESTLLRLSDISIRSDVERLSLRDMTIDCLNDGLFDLRSGNAALDISRVRIVRFRGALFDGDDGTVLVMRNSEILGGYGKRPDSGSLVGSAGSPVNAMRFENVRFELIDMEFHSMKHGLFLGCSFDRMTEHDMSGEQLVEFRGCAFGEILPSGFDRSTLQRSLNELFPGSVD
jgi:hypothetical protein